MIEVAYLREKEKLKNLPQEVKNVAENILKVLDEEYGMDRNRYENDGGFIIVVERKEDLEEIKSETYIDCDDVIAEYADKILCSGGELFYNCLILLNNDYSVSLIIPENFISANLKSYSLE